ncbi:hypothetical protein BH18ACT11_BH18ACT11_18210 [soil metagenome]
MRSRTAAWLAWSMAGLWTVLFIATVALAFLSVAAGDMRSSDIIGQALVFVPFSAFPVVGALIASRRPRNPIGWICLADGLLWMLITLAEGYSGLGLARPGSVPFPVTIDALLYAWLWVPAVGLLGTFLLLLFPDGRLPSRRWRPLAWISGAVVFLVSVLTFVIPGPLEGLGGARNPFGLEGQPWVVPAGWIVLPLLPLCMIASAASLVVRFRRSVGEVRQQIKWIALAASFMGLVYLAVMSGGLISYLLSPEAPVDLGEESLWGSLLENVMLISFASVPVAIGFAVLKYRLYDIDRIINRTLVYGALTLTLVTLYVSGIVLLQRLFVILTGQEKLPQLAVVVSTLVIAALFSPLRRRIQSFIDRRFYRRKYDARKILETYSGKLRDETDLAALEDELKGVVGETVQPEHVTLWLRPDSNPRDGLRD